MWYSWFNFVLGAWLIIASFIPVITTNKSFCMGNNIIVGILLVIFAYLSTRVKKSMCWINVVAGIWLFISAFISGIVGSQSGNFWNYLIVGIIVAVVGIWASLSNPATE